MEITKFIPLDKSWIIRMGILDLVNGYDDINSFLSEQENLGDDLIALKNVAELWKDKNVPLDVGESGTLYRFVRFALWSQKSNREIIKYGTLKDRDLCNNPEIINWPLQKLLTLDNGTSQWASASVLIGNDERLENAPTKLKLTYEAVEHWKSQREKKLCWEPKYDETIKKQALAYINLLKTGNIDFAPEHSEDYCFARAFELITPEQGKQKFPSLEGHETNRITEMEEALQNLKHSQEIKSKDHRVVQALAMKQFYEGKDIITDKKVVNKSWSQFWKFMRYCSKNCTEIKPLCILDLLNKKVLAFL